MAFSLKKINNPQLTSQPVRTRPNTPIKRGDIEHGSTLLNNFIGCFQNHSDTSEKKEQKTNKLTEYFI